MTLGDTGVCLVEVAGMSSGWIEKRGMQSSSLTIARRNREKWAIAEEGIVTSGGLVLLLSVSGEKESCWIEEVSLFLETTAHSWRQSGW